jgi:alpha-glucoside transport system permease protein
MAYLILGRRQGRGPRWGRILLHAVVLAACAAWLLPSLGLLVSSFRPRSQIALSGWWTAFESPFSFTLKNYQNVLSRSGMGRSFLNSLLISVPSTLIPICVASFAAYAFAWMRFKGKELLYALVIGLLVVPLQMTVIPVLRLYNSLGLTGSFAGIWLAHTAYGLPFAVYLLRNFIQELPASMLESAFIDGASHPTVFLRLVLPTSLPAIASLAIYQFMWVWNDLFVALIYLGGSREVAPMTLTMANMVNSYGGGWELLTAAAFVSMAFPLLVFFTMQKHYVRGILAGSVKE